MAEYQQIWDSLNRGISTTILRRIDNAFIPNDPANRDYQEYLEWLDKGNEPDPPDVIPMAAAPEAITEETTQLSPEAELQAREAKE